MCDEGVDHCGWRVQGPIRAESGGSPHVCAEMATGRELTYSHLIRPLRVAPNTVYTAGTLAAPPPPRLCPQFPAPAHLLMLSAPSCAHQGTQCESHSPCPPTHLPPAQPAPPLPVLSTQPIFYCPQSSMWIVMSFGSPQSWKGRNQVVMSKCFLFLSVKYRKDNLPPHGNHFCTIIKR